MTTQMKHPSLLRSLGVVSAAALLVTAAACRMEVNKGENGHDKNVKIDTPLGGLHVNTDETEASDIGLPVYPGARITQDNDGHKSADVHLGFGDWQLRVKAVQYESHDSQDKIAAFYQKALGRYGDVIHCQGNSAVGAPAITREGLTCDEAANKDGVHIDTGDRSDGLSLKAGSKRHQHIMAIQRGSSSDLTKFALVQMDLPAVIGSSDDKAN